MNQKEWAQNLNVVFKNLKLERPKNYSIYKEAFTHISYANENGLTYNYERLEFLGDSAIQWIIVNFLYGIKNKLSEGDMSIIKGNLVKKDTLIEQAKKIGLDKLIFLGNSIQKDKIPSSILEDVFESFMGAIAQDQGIKKVSQVLNMTIIDGYKKNSINTSKDAKTELQEIIQASNSCKLEYKHTPCSNKRWRTDLYLVFNNERMLLATAEANNTSESDQLAAQRGKGKAIILNHK